MSGNSDEERKAEEMTDELDLPETIYDLRNDHRVYKLTQMYLPGTSAK